MARRNKLVLLALVASMLLLFIGFDGGQYFTTDYFLARREALQSWVQQHQLLASVGYLFVYILVLALSIPVTALLTLAGGALFGLAWGVVLVSFGASLGCLASFLLSRSLLRDWVQQRFGHRLQGVNRGVAKEGGFYLFGLRLVPIFPPAMINLLMGLTPMPAWQFYWVSQLGMLPATVVYVNAGTRLGEVVSLQGLVSVPVLLSFTLLGIFPLLAQKILAAYRASRVLLRFKRPANFDTNLIVIGAGSGGLVAALIAATVKAKVTLIERDRMGGDCLNTGCVPSKTLLRSASAMHAVATAEQFGVKASGAADFARVMARVQEVIATIAPHDSVERFTGLGVDCVQGEARILSPWQVEVNGRCITAPHIIVATGAAPLVPAFNGLEKVIWSSSDSIWEVTELPQRLVVLGAGPIGCEMAQAFARLGASVCLVDMAGRILPREDADVAQLMQQQLAGEGIDIRLEHKVERFERVDGEQQLVASHNGGEQVLRFDRVLIAIGRKPNVHGFGLEEVGVETGAGGSITVDEYLRTTVPTIYACGDVVGPYQFTHMASHQAWYAAVNTLFGGFKKFKVDYSVVPWCTFTDPEVARVGLSEVEAAERGIAVEVVTYSLQGHDRAITDGANQGFVKVLVVPGKERILGACIVGEHAGELIGEFVLAMKHGLGLGKILGTIHVYPTLLEANKFAAGNWRKAHTPHGLLRWVEKYHRWRRH